jgi:hypothetical protein
MKKSSSKLPSPRKDFPDCDSSPPYPPNPPPTGEIPGKEILNFVYYGEKDTAKGYNDGQLVQHSMQLLDEEQISFISLRGGPHKRRTLSKLALKALLGPCTVVIENGPTTVLQTDDTTDIPAGSTFSLEAQGKAVIQATSLAGPGLGDPPVKGGTGPH